MLETLSAAAIASVHLSRFAEELVIWTSPLVETWSALSGKFFPPAPRSHRRSFAPDAAELVRALSGRVIGALTALLIVMKGLPLAYQKDMQEDKQGAIEAFGALSLAVRAMTGMVADMLPDEARMKLAAGEGYATATDLADWLVRTLKMPFRDAHHVTGRIVARAAKDGAALHELPLQTMQTIEPRNHGGSLEGAVGRGLGEKPHELWWNSAEECCGAGQGVAQAAGKRAKIGLSAQTSPPGASSGRGSSPERGILCMVPPLWGYRRESCF